MNKVVVIGAGVIGLTTAVKIQEDLGSSVSVTIISEKLSPNTTGDVSAGLWGPYLMQDTLQENIKKWSKQTFDHFHSLWASGKAKETGISLLPIYYLSSTKEWKEPFWSDVPFGLRELSERELRILSENTGITFTSGITYLAFTCEPCKYLPYIQEIFIRNGGTIKCGKIEKLENIANDCDVIVNCCGLSARTVTDDPAVIPIRGQILRVEAPWLNFGILTVEGNYIIPNCNCTILGGTAQFDNYSLEVDENDKSQITQTCCCLVPSLKDSRILTNEVGLRPGRNKVRIELEIRKVNGKYAKIVHNYGHGGCGVTLCIGCATEASKLVTEALKINKNKL